MERAFSVFCWCEPDKYERMWAKILRIVTWGLVPVAQTTFTVLSFFANIKSLEIFADMNTYLLIVTTLLVAGGWVFGVYVYEHLKWTRYRLELLAEWQSHAQSKYIGKAPDKANDFQLDMQQLLQARIEQIANQEDLPQRKVIRRLELPGLQYTLSYNPPAR